MNVHEYVAKNLMRSYGLPVAQAELLRHADEIDQVLLSMPEGPWVVKAQVYSGARGKAGGICLVDTKEALRLAVANLLGSQLVTAQRPEGLLVSSLLIEQTVSIEQEWYLSALIDHSHPHARVVFMISSQGGMNVESNQHSSMLRIEVDPTFGYLPYLANDLYTLGLDAKGIKVFSDIMSKCYQMVCDLDLTLLEINPLVVTNNGQLLCLDGKITMDDNAYFRQASLVEQDDLTQYDPKERQASQSQLNYVAMDGNIGCMVNGAGLAMATMDIIHSSQGKAANFLDVGGGVTADRVIEGFRIILSDAKVRVIFVNIFGGIVRCDVIAQGIVHAMNVAKLTVPVVVRLVGNQASEALALLSEVSPLLHVEEDFSLAASLAVSLAEGEIR